MSKLDLDSIMKLVGEYVMKEWLQLPFKKILEVDEGVIDGGYCETCAYTTTGIEIKFEDFRGDVRYEQAELRFVDAMKYAMKAHEELSK